MSSEGKNMDFGVIFNVFCDCPVILSCDNGANTVSRTNVINNKESDSKWEYFIMQVACYTSRRLFTTLHKSPQLYKVLFGRLDKNFALAQGRTRTKSTEAFKLKSTLYYIVSGGVLVVGLSYAAVPLYRMFCQAYSYGGTTASDDDVSKIENMSKKENRVLTIKFNADLGASMRWNFKPMQAEISVIPGETALAFYTAKNSTNTPVVGISTYNVVPFEAGQYFNKIQCFCFEEQQLNPHEEVDMPVYFYIDPAFCDDPKMELIDTITLSYTFFEAMENIKLPTASYVTHKPLLNSIK